MIEFKYSRILMQKKKIPNKKNLVWVTVSLMASQHLEILMNMVFERLYNELCQYWKIWASHRTECFFKKQILDVTKLYKGWVFLPVPSQSADFNTTSIFSLHTETDSWNTTRCWVWRRASRVFSEGCQYTHSAWLRLCRKAPHTARDWRWNRSEGIADTFLLSQGFTERSQGAFLPPTLRAH